LVLAVVTVEQGAVVALTLPGQPGMKAVEVSWGNHKVPAVRAQEDWATFLGVDLETEPGTHRAAVMFTFEDGRVEKQETAIQVVKRSFPTTELKVAEEYVRLSAANQARAAREAKEIEAIYSKVTAEMLWQKPFRSPIAGQDGRNFGHRRVFNGEPRAPHAGADLRARTGSPVHATNRGRVVLAKSLFFTGNTVILDHGLGIYSLYAHLSRIGVKYGEMVENGQLIGLAGATGRVTGPHLHWGMRVQGARVDPFSLVKLGR
jgi:murein DD-endopeptidase MepM/ murein hydrolase activator NlpD